MDVIIGGKGQKVTDKRALRVAARKRARLDAKAALQAEKDLAAEIARLERQPIMVRVSTGSEEIFVEQGDGRIDPPNVAQRIVARRALENAIAAIDSEVMLELAYMAAPVPSSAKRVKPIKRTALRLVVADGG